MRWLVLNTLFFLTLSLQAADEHIWGVLEKTVKPGACAQIQDTLGDTYYILRSDEAERVIAPYLGKSIRVQIVGNSEIKDGDTARYFVLKSVTPIPAK